MNSNQKGRLMVIISITCAVVIFIVSLFFGYPVRYFFIPVVFISGWFFSKGLRLKNTIDDMPFKTTSRQVKKIPEIVKQMNDFGLDKKFVKSIAALASFDQNTFKLMSLWAVQEHDPVERKNLILDLENVLKDCTVNNKLKK